MSVLLVDTSSDPFYTQTTNFEGTDYLLEFRFNQRESDWRMSISQQDGTLLASFKIVCSMPMLRRFTDPRLPPGELIAVSNTNDISPPGLNDFGLNQRVTLTYFESTGLL